MTALIKDLIVIPDRVHKGDFVLRLTEGVRDPEGTLREYVVTPQLTACFDNALGFIADAVRTKSSKAAYLHGSFGCGKSHFMAVLHLLLSGEKTARSAKGLADPITKHAPALHGKKFLLVPYHMIGARNMESAILGGYARHVASLHPDAPTPGVFLAEKIFENANNLRSTMGDEKFFESLNKFKSGDSGWGDLETGWDAKSFGQALDAPPGTEERTRLVSDLVDTLLTSFRDVARERGEAYVSLDDGLSVVSRHASALGYDAVILFLDELILWLASHAADTRFLHQEGQKLAKLVEAQSADRPAPLVSFVARQRDLRELIGESVTGFERLNFGDALKHWEGRFHTITLEDRNLPAIAEKRVLTPKSDDARRRMDAAFEETARIREEVMNTLLTRKYDRTIFRQVYPFSPALVDVLVDVSSVLQRERTALKVLMQLLVDQRDTLELGDIVPVGDLFDIIAHGDEALNEDMQRHFDMAKTLYHEKILYILEREHGLKREEAAALPHGDDRRKAFENDDRLVKTLLLAALVPGAESLKDLTAGRLAALNHGTIQTPIPGREGQEVLRRLRGWAAEVGEIRIGEDPVNPTISVQLTGVDTESILERARREDNPGNRIRQVRQMLFEELGVSQEKGLFDIQHPFSWKNTDRSCLVVFGNIRTLPDESLENEGDEWKLVVDWPFDEPNRTPRDDLSRLESYREMHDKGARTLCWVPSFLSTEQQRDLGTLVILEYVLTGERFDDHASHLSMQDRSSARALLNNQRSQLHQRVKNHLEAAYGVLDAARGPVDRSLDLSEHFVSLAPGFRPQPPVSPDLKGAMVHLLGQALEHQFPAHPDFEAAITRTTVKKVQEELRKAIQAKDGRVAVDKAVRPLMNQIAAPLRLGEMGPTHFVLGNHWKDHFGRKIAENPGAPVTVARLREWMNLPRPMGLPRMLQDLIVLGYAEQTNCSFYLHGAACDADAKSVRDELELRREDLPDEKQWVRAVGVAHTVFGLSMSDHLNAYNLGQLASKYTERITKDVRITCESIAYGLKDWVQRLAIPLDDAHRLKTANAAHALLESMAGADAHRMVEVLDGARIETSQSAMATSISTSMNEISPLFATTKWDLFDAVAKLPGEFGERGKKILGELAEAVAADEYVTPLKPAVERAQALAVSLLSEAAGKPLKPPVPPAPGWVVVDHGERGEIGPEDAMGLIERLKGKTGKGQDLRLWLKWRIEKEGK